MKYSLRSLMIVMLMGPPLLAAAWHSGNKLFAKPSPPDKQAFSFDLPVGSLTPRIIIQPEEEDKLGLNTEP